jgi:hypothetical protein
MFLDFCAFSSSAISYRKYSKQYYPGFALTVAGLDGWGTLGASQPKEPCFDQDKTGFPEFGALTLEHQHVCDEFKDAGWKTGHDAQSRGGSSGIRRARIRGARPQPARVTY